MAHQDEHLLSEGFLNSTDPETNGFDLSSGSKWIYPENFPKRDYQFSIVQTALYNNTLVCLPTGRCLFNFQFLCNHCNVHLHNIYTIIPFVQKGLGKTFIAAVVMYNFWRWYPRGRVVFMAPTKPLVAQQINACHEVMGVPSDETIELTGN